jgi:Na+/H+-translocating membrane pyrophosphatase
MKGQSETRIILEVTAFVIAMGAFFFDIVGVFGLAFAITGMVIAIGMAIAVCLKRPVEGQGR